MCVRACVYEVLLDAVGVYVLRVHIGYAGHSSCLCVRLCVGLTVQVLTYMCVCALQVLTCV